MNDVCHKSFFSIFSFAIKRIFFEFAVRTLNINSKRQTVFNEIISFVLFILDRKENSKLGSFVKRILNYHEIMSEKNPAPTQRKQSISISLSLSFVLWVETPDTRRYLFSNKMPLKISFKQILRWKSHKYTITIILIIFIILHLNAFCSSYYTPGLTFSSLTFYYYPLFFLQNWGERKTISLRDIIPDVSWDVPRIYCKLIHTTANNC